MRINHHGESSSSSSPSSEVCSVCSQRYSLSSSSEDEVLQKHEITKHKYVHSLDDLNEDNNEDRITGMIFRKYTNSGIYIFRFLLYKLLTWDMNLINLVYWDYYLRNKHWERLFKKMVNFYVSSESLE